MSDEIVKAPQEVDTLQKLSKELFASALFDSKNPSQIFAKILAGRELGIEPIASITGINIVQGKPCLGANLIATLIARHPAYSYKVIRTDHKVCEIEIYEKKGSYRELLGTCSFTIEEATAAGLANKDNWKKYPSDMLFARCITRAARRFAPGIFGGSPVYTPEELNVDTDEEGRIIEGEIEKKPGSPPPIDTKKLASTEKIAQFQFLSEMLAIPDEKIKERLTKYGLDTIEKITEQVLDKWIDELLKKANAQDITPIENKQEADNGAYIDTL